MPITLVRAVALALLSVAALGLLVHVGLSTIFAAPSQPLVLFGLAKTQSGTPVPSGALIEARIENVNYAQTVNPSTGVGSQDTRTHSLSSGFNYGTAALFQVCADDSATGGIEGGAVGDQMVFYVAGIQAEARRVGVDGSPQPSIPFIGGGVRQVELTIPSLTAPTAIPASTSTSACEMAQAPSAPTATPTVVSTPTATPSATPTATPTPTAPVFFPPTPTPTPAPTPEPVPAASAWGLAALGTVLAALTALAMRRRPMSS